MTYLSNIVDEFNEFSEYLNSIMPAENKTKPLKDKIKDAVVLAYSNGYHDGQQAMADRLPEPTDTGGDSGGEQYYNSL
jgi:hypothetical protein